MTLTKEQAERLVHFDPFKDGMRRAMADPLENAVRGDLVKAFVAHLHETLEDRSIADDEAYRTFVRVISMLTTYLPDRWRR